MTEAADKRDEVVQRLWYDRELAAGQAKIARLEAELEKTHNYYIEDDRDLNDLIEQNEKLTKENQQLRTQLAERDKKIERLKRLFRVRDAEHDHQGKAFRDANKEIERLKAETEQQDKAIQNLNANLCQRDEEVAALQDEIERLSIAKNAILRCIDVLKNRDIDEDGYTQGEVRRLNEAAVEVWNTLNSAMTHFEKSQSEPASGK